ncbi:MAG: hypothetical protein R2843_02160 [Thermomicrobiales bacterium]
MRVERSCNLFPAEDYRTTALGDTDQAGLPFWIGLEVTVSNNRSGGSLSHFPATAFVPVDATRTIPSHREHCS